MFAFTSTLQKTPETTSDTPIDTEEFVDAFPVNKEDALSFLCTLGAKNRRSLATRSVANGVLLDGVARGEAVEQIAISDDEEVVRLCSVPIEAEALGLSPLDWMVEHPPLHEPASTVRRSVFGGLSSLLWNRRSAIISREQTLFATSSPTTGLRRHSSQMLPTQPLQRPSQDVSLAPFPSDDAKVSNKLVRTHPTTGLWRQAPFRKSRKAGHSRKGGVSFAELLVPSKNRWTLPVFYDSLERRPLKTVAQPLRLKRLGLFITMEPLSGSKTLKRQINDKFKHVRF